MITIYVDVLICVNFFVNYFILLCVKKFLSLNTKNSRLIISSALASLFSLLIFLPPLPSPLSLLIKIACSVVTVLMIFGFKGKRCFFRQLCVFVFTNVGFCGIILLVSGISVNKITVVNNDWIYLHISPVFFLIMTLVCYFIFRAAQLLTSHRTDEYLIHRIKVKRSGKTWEFLGKTDTGCSLYEPFSGSPVIIADAKIFSKEQGQKTSSKGFPLHSLNESEAEPNIFENASFRIIPYETLSGAGFLKAFKADEVYIDGKKSEKEIYIAISQGKLKDHDSTMALLNHDISD